MNEDSPSLGRDRGTVVVTGVSSGIGRATVDALRAAGFDVLAGVRSPADAAQLEAPGVEPLILDITEPDQVEALARRVGELPGAGAPRALVNNAGVAINAPVEALPLARWRRQFEVNYFGDVAVTQALLPAMLESRGRVVNVSSIGGRVAGPTFGAYAGAKFALEAMSDSLRREVARFGVEVVVVEPGAVATPIWGKGSAAFDEMAAAMEPARRRRYADLEAAMRAQAETMARQGLAPGAVAAVIIRAITARRPRTRYLVGRDAKVAARLACLLPDRLLDSLIARNLGLARPRGGE